MNQTSIRPNTEYSVTSGRNYSAEYSAEVAEYAEYQKLRENGQKTPKFRQN